jgi:hypothetical protein
MKLLFLVLFVLCFVSPLMSNDIIMSDEILMIDEMREMNSNLTSFEPKTYSGDITMQQGQNMYYFIDEMVDCVGCIYQIDSSDFSFPLNSGVYLPNENRFLDLSAGSFQTNYSGMCAFVLQCVHEVCSVKFKITIFMSTSCPQVCTVDNRPLQEYTPTHNIKTTQNPLRSYISCY